MENIQNKFVASDPNERICGTCGSTLPTHMFYKDGYTSGGVQKYRRDCKDCYKVTRIKESKQKKGRNK